MLPLGKLQQVLENYNTTYDVEKLRELAVKISTLPADKNSSIKFLDYSKPE